MQELTKQDKSVIAADARVGKVMDWSLKVGIQKFSLTTQEMDIVKQSLLTGKKYVILDDMIINIDQISYAKRKTMLRSYEEDCYEDGRNFKRYWKYTVGNEKDRVKITKTEHEQIQEALEV